MAYPELTYLDLARCLSKVDRLVDTLTEFAKDLDEHKFNANVSKAVGGATATLGSGLAIGGFIASFFTFGAASILIPVGIAVGAAGGGTVAGTAIAEIVIKKKKIEEAQKLWDAILQDGVMQEYMKTIDDPEVEEAQGSGIAKGVTRGVKAGAQIGGMVAKAAGKTALEAAKISARALVLAGAAMEVVILPLNLYDLINSSIEAHKRRKCPAGEELRKVAEKFNDVRKRLHEQLDVPATHFMPRPL